MLVDDATAKPIASLVPAGGDEDAETMRKRALKAFREAERSLDNIMDVIEKGIMTDGIQERIDRLELQKACAKSNLTALDTELFVQFLRFSATPTDEELVDAFVYHALVSNDDVVLVLNFDINKNESVRLNRTDSSNYQQRKTRPMAGLKVLAPRAGFEPATR